MLSNVNPLLSRYPGAIGSKTGFTDAARHTIVGAAERDGRRLVVSVVRAEHTPVVNWRQAAALLDWGFALPEGRPPVGTLVDAAPPPPTASAGTPAVGHLHRPLTRGVPLPGGIVLPGGSRRSRAPQPQRSPSCCSPSPWPAAGVAPPAPEREPAPDARRRR